MIVLGSCNNSFNLIKIFNKDYSSCEINWIGIIKTSINYQGRYSEHLINHFN